MSSLLNYMVSLLLASSNTPILVISENADIISNYFLVWIYTLASLCMYFVYMVSLLSWSVSVINCTRVVLFSLLNYMVSLLLTSSNSPILVNPENILSNYFLVWIYIFASLCRCLVCMVSLLCALSIDPVLVFL